MRLRTTRATFLTALIGAAVLAGPVPAQIPSPDDPERPGMTARDTEDIKQLTAWAASEGEYVENRMRFVAQLAAHGPRARAAAPALIAVLTNGKQYSSKYLYTPDLNALRDSGLLSPFDGDQPNPDYSLPACRDC